MIPDSVFQPQLNDIEQLLKTLELFAERLRSPNSALGASDFKGKSYREQYDLAFRELAYDFRLGDQSLIRFVKAGKDVQKGSLNYSYYEAPVSVMSYEGFVAYTAGVSAGQPDYEAALEQAGDEFMSDYEEYVTSADLKAAVTPLRYDYKATDYRPGIHPASHLHFGFANDIRVGTRRIMTPLAFVLFIIRQRYPSGWALVQQRGDCAKLCRNVRDKLETVDKRYWCEGDERELFLK